MRRFLLTISLLLLALGGWTQYFPLLRYQKFYGKYGDDIPRKLIKTSDGFLITGGNSEVQNADGTTHRNVWIMKLDTLGDLYWERELFLPGEQELRDLTSSYDGGVVFAGVSASPDHPERGNPEFAGDFFVGKIDSTGQLAWTRTYGGQQLDQAFALARGPYREYLLAGGSHSRSGDLEVNYGMSDVWLLKVDTRGNKRFSKQMGGSRSDWATCLISCKDGDYVFAGFTNSPETTEHQLSRFGNGLVVRMSSSGITRWSKVFPVPEGGHFTDVAEDADGNLVLVGKNQEKSRQFWFVKLSADGDILSEKSFGPHTDDHLTAISPCQTGGYLLGGYSRNSNGHPLAKGGDDFWLFRTDEMGRIIWRQTFGGPDNERCADVIEYRPGVIFALGEKVNDFTKESGSRGKDFWLLRIDEKPCDSLKADIFIRTNEDYEITRDTRVRFKAMHQYAERFLWDFGDGTSSEEEKPLKAFSLPGMYRVKLTLYANEGCEQEVMAGEYLKVR